MKLRLHHALLALGCLLAAGSAAAGANVKFVEPEHFSDVPFASWERDDVLKDLRGHFDRLAARLPAGQELNVEVTDVDLAGRTWPTRFQGRDIRVMNGGADWPHMSLRYTITQNGQVIKSGVEELNDMAYQQRATRYGSDDALRYEKRMLDQWFKERIAAR
jgi:hypothetical protein